jgi:hypothetical protein
MLAQFFKLLAAVIIDLGQFAPSQHFLPFPPSQRSKEMFPCMVKAAGATVDCLKVTKFEHLRPKASNAENVDREIDEAFKEAAENKDRVDVEDAAGLVGRHWEEDGQDATDWSHQVESGKDADDDQQGSRHLSLLHLVLLVVGELPLKANPRLVR